MPFDSTLSRRVYFILFLPYFPTSLPITFHAGRKTKKMVFFFLTNVDAFSLENSQSTPIYGLHPKVPHFYA